MGMKPRKPHKMPPLAPLAVAYGQARRELGLRPKNRPRGDRIRDAVLATFNSCGYRASTQAIVMIHVVPEIAHVEGKLARFVNAETLAVSQRPVYDITVREDWAKRVATLHLAKLDSHLVLDADSVPVDDGCRVAGVVKIWAVAYVVQGHGYGLRLERGLCGEMAAGSRVLVPYRTAHEGEAELDVIRRCRRQLARKARKLRYQGWKEMRGA